jgi:hypothetical protein
VGGVCHNPGLKAREVGGQSGTRVSRLSIVELELSQEKNRISRPASNLCLRRSSLESCLVESAGVSFSLPWGDTESRTGNKSRGFSFS